MTTPNAPFRKFALLRSGILAVVLPLSTAFAQIPTPPPFGPAITAPGSKTLATSDMTNSLPQIPADIYRGPNPTSADLATYAWLEFISVVSPASSQRGATGGSFAKSGASPTTTLVWETYQHREELLPFNTASTAPVAPQPWGAAPKYVVSSKVSVNKGPASNTIGLTNFNNLDEASQIGQNLLFFPKTPGTPQPGTDAQVLFEAKVNQYEWAFANQNYKTLIPYQNPFRMSPPITLPTGSVEVKAGWRPIESIPQAQRYRYHTASVIVYSGTDANPVATTATYALIALHIIHKSPNYPSFIFATFEQVDDLQNQATTPASATGVYYVPTYQSIAYNTPYYSAGSNLLYTPASGGKPATTFFSPFPPVPPPVPAKFQPPVPTVNPAPSPAVTASFNPAKPVALPNGNSVALPLGSVSSIPNAKTVTVTVGGNPQQVVAVPVTQPVATVAGVMNVNAQALTAMKGIPGFGPNFVWQYYKLAGVQAVPTNDETSSDFYLANIVVESSQPGIQLFRGFPPITGSAPNGVLNDERNQVNVIDAYTTPATMTSSGGCQGCHGIAQSQDGLGFSFLFFGVNGAGFAPDAAGVQTAEAAAARLKSKKYLQ